MPEIDAIALCRIAGLTHLQLNTWVSRGLVPGGSDTDQRGKRRLYDLPITLHVSTTALLVSLGFDVSFAALCASEAANAYDRSGSKLVIGPRRYTSRGRPTGSRTVDVIDAPEPGDLDDALAAFTDGRPEAFCVVELDRLGARVRESFKEEADQRERGFIRSAFRRRVESKWENDQ
jgi:hypothetical protein